MCSSDLETPEAGNTFLKLTGPAATVAQQAAGFQKMVEGLVPVVK